MSPTRTLLLLSLVGCCRHSMQWGRAVSTPTLSFSSIRAQGRLDADADRLSTVKPELEATGKVTLGTEFDLAISAGAIRVDHFIASVAGKNPVARIEALQPFEYNTDSGELKVADPNSDLVGLSIQGLPVAWIRPFVPGLAIQGDDIHGDFTLDAGSGGLAVRSKAPLSVTNLSVLSGQRTLCSGIGLQAYLSGIYTPQGWQVQLAPLTVTSIGVKMLSVQGKAGKLTGKGQPITTTAHWELSLPALVSQPVSGGKFLLTGGLAKGDVTMTFDSKREIETTIAITQLAVDPSVSTETLPEVSAGLRADFDGTGSVAFRAPVSIKRGDSASDLTLTGSITPSSTSARFALQVAGDKVCVDDCKLFTVFLAPSKPADSNSPAAAPGALVADKEGAWAAFEGKIGVSLKSVVLHGKPVATAVEGAVHVAPGAVTVERLKGSFGEGSSAKVSGVVSFDASAPTPYALTGELSIDNFSANSLLTSLDPSKAALVDGKFNVSGNFGGRGLTLPDLENKIEGDLQLTSKGGSFNALSVGIGSKVQDPSRIASAVASIGGLASALTGRKDVSDIASKAQAVAEFCKALSPIHYDQLSVSLSRGSDLNFILKDFSLISPDLRLLGTGQVTYDPTIPMAEWPLSLAFSLRARGRTVDLLKKANALEAKPDDLGYTACTIPFNVAGTVGQPDTGELQQSLTKLAVEKSDLFDRLLGR